MSGTSGWVYGANSCWQMYQPGLGYKAVCGLDEDASWRKDLDSFRGAAQLRHLSALVEGLAGDAFDRRAPAQDILLEGSQEGEERVSVCRDVYADKPSTFVYAYSGMGRPFTLDVAKAFGGTKPATSYWLNPRNGTKSSISVDSSEFTPPSSGSIEQDWALVLTA